MKGKIIYILVMTLLITTFVTPALGLSLQKEHNTIDRDITLDVAITTDWVNGWQDHGLLTREFGLNQDVYAYFEISSPDNLYGTKMTHEWYYDNGTGLELKWTWWTTCGGNWTSWATWTWWAIGIDYGRGIGIVKVYVDDELFGETNWYAVDNTQPNTPTIDGPTSGTSGTDIDFDFTATDPDGQQISYFVDWGDGEDTGWSQFVASGTKITLTHSWEKGDYTINCKVRDIAHHESDEATLDIEIPRTRAINYQFNIFERLFSRFPNAFPLLRSLLA